MPVRFTGDAFSEVRKSNDGEIPHGVIDPFVSMAALDNDTMFWVLLFPGLASAPQHNFDLQIALTQDMEDGQWDCRDCSD
jgi:hypothetical protein